MWSYPHNLVGGHPALDFVNSVHDWYAAPRDYLGDAADAIAFGVACGILSADEAQLLSASTTERELTRLRALRASLERVFRAEVAGRKAVAADLAAVSREASAATSAAVLQHRQGRLVRRIDPAGGGGATLRWRLAEAAVELLTSPEMERVKACPSCGWFFRDESKNGSRRWCSMATCGSIEKSRAYYARTRRKAR